MSAPKINLIGVRLHEFKVQADALRLDILKLAAARNLDSAVVALAMADVLAEIAVASDLQDGRSSLKDRLHSFCARVEETHKRMQALAHERTKHA